MFWSGEEGCNRSLLLSPNKMNRHKLNDKCENKNIKDLRMVLPMFHINLKP